MMEVFEHSLKVLFDTALAVLPIILFLLFFQFVVLRKPLPGFRKALIGFFYVTPGLALFLIGLEEALFPLGDLMAKQLTDPAFVFGEPSTPENASWLDYYWIYIFAAAIGFSTTVAEPSLIAVSMKASELSGGALQPWKLRIAVAIGVSVSIAVGALRIVTGAPLYVFMIAGYLVVIIQTIFAPKLLVPLAYDSGGVTTSTVTVPLVTALGLGLAASVPGRSPVIDGFGLIALASLFPMITVMGYAQISTWLSGRKNKQANNPNQENEDGL